MIREAIRDTLLGNGPVAAAVGERVFPLRMPQGQREPSLVYQRVGGIADTTLDGPQVLRETRLQLTAWALDPDAAANLIHLAEVALNGFTGTVAVDLTSPPTQVKLSGIFLDNERDGYDAPAQLYHDGRDFRVLWCLV